MSQCKVATDEGLERLEAFDRVADSFLARVRRGERPSISDYTARYPELADQIGELLPILVEMELAKSAGVAAETGSFMPDTRDAGEIPRNSATSASSVESATAEWALSTRRFRRGSAATSRSRSSGRSSWPNRAFFSGSGAEAQAAAQLHHAHIVPVFDAGTHDGVPYFAMQFISGQSLDAILPRGEAAARE